VRGDESAVRRQVGQEEQTYEMAAIAARAASAMFGRETVLIDMREAVSYTDYFVITSAETDRQTRRIAEEVIEKMNEAGYRPRSRRLEPESAWISLDYIDIVVHIFTDEARDYYRLESLWKSAPQEHWEE
jgi:ribosome-associated protein